MIDHHFQMGIHKAKGCFGDVITLGSLPTLFIASHSYLAATLKITYPTQSTFTFHLWLVLLSPDGTPGN